MDKRKLNWITMAFVVLTVLVVGLMLSHTLRRTSHITLPEALPTGGEISGEPSESGELPTVEILPETVQLAIETLERPENYSRPVTVEYYWAGGSGAYQTLVAARGGVVRTDRTMPDGQTRHTMTDGEETYIWYNDEETPAVVPAGSITADNEQAIPTYEEILLLPVDFISAADYRELSGQRCIYVETLSDDQGYALHYWVSVDSGLLVSAEKMLDGKLVYRMDALELSTTEPDAALFLLPDGSSLL